MITRKLANHIEITLPDQSTALIDLQDEWILNVFSSWRRVKIHVRVVRYVPTEYGTAREEYYLHRLITKAPVGIEIDHINRDGLDNRRSNLRWSTHSQNMLNKAKKLGCHSKYRGVGFRKGHSTGKPWRAYVTKDRKQLHLGWFATEIEAARAYNAAAMDLYGEFAIQNVDAGGKGV